MPVELVDTRHARRTRPPAAASANVTSTRVSARCAQRLDGVDELEPPVADQGDAVGDVLHLGEDVGRDEDGAAVRRRLGDELVDDLLDERVEARMVGSSKTASAGRCMSAWTSPTFCRFPFESARDRPVELELESSGEPLAVADVAHPAQRREVRAGARAR